MEKEQPCIFKSAVILDLAQDFNRNVTLIDYSLKRTLKEIKIYFISGNEQKYNYGFLEKILAFLYNFTFFEKQEDFLFKTGIFFPFLFEIPIESIMKSEKFDAIFTQEHFDLNHEKAIKVKCDNSVFSASIPESQQFANGNQIFSLKTLAIGGTFDYLHSGHKLFLSCSALLAAKKSAVLTIGLTGEELLKKKQGLELIQPFSLRKTYVLAFLKEFHPFLDVNIVELQEPCGPTKDQDFEGLIVTLETVKGGDFINDIRQKAGFKPLKVFVTGLVLRNDYEAKLSSGEIRKELIKRSGITDNKEIWQFLRKGWETELQGAISPELRNSWLDRVLLSYLEKWRSYHNLLHVYEMLKLYEEFKEVIHEKRRVFLAIWFHDAVYVPTDKRNEENSAELLREFSRDFMSENQENETLKKEFETIAEYILITKDHFQVPEKLFSKFLNYKIPKPLPEKFKNDKDLFFFLDFDLAIIGSEPDRYSSYCQGVYEEYKAVPNLSSKRLEFLKSMKPPIYRSVEFLKKFEEKASINIQNEIESLQKQLSNNNNNK